VARTLRLKEAGLNHCEIARLTGVSCPTIRGWRSGNLPHSYRHKPLLYGRGAGFGSSCSRCGSDEHRFEELSTSYVYLLGLYLSDGCISRGARDVFRLRIALDRKYPEIIEECATAMQAVVPGTRYIGS